MPRHLSLVAYNTPPTPASQDHASCETFASTPLRLNSPLFLSYVGPQSPLVRPRASRPPLYSLLCSLVNRGEREQRSFIDCKTSGGRYKRSGETSRLAEVLEWRTRRERSERSVRNRTSPFSFTCDSFHSSLLRRGATEPPDSHSPSTRSTCSTRPTLCALRASASLR